MALSRSRPAELPHDAVIINEEQAITYQWKLITGWEPATDVWSLRWGPGILGAISAAVGVYVNTHYRRKLKLGNYGKISTYLPIVVIPAMFSVLAHKFFIQRTVILDQLSECPLCVQLRAAAFQSALGVCYPTVLAPFAAFMFATRHFTYRLPSVTEQPKEVFLLWRRMTRPIFPMLGVALGVQGIVAMYITYKETEQMWRMQMKMQQMEQQVERERELQAVQGTTAAVQF